MEEQIKELTLLLLYLTSWKEKDPFGDEYMRAWKGYDFDILNKLQDEKLIYALSLEINSRRFFLWKFFIYIY